MHYLKKCDKIGWIDYYKLTSKIMAEKKLNLNALLKETDAEEALAATLEEIPDEIPKEIPEEVKEQKTEEKDSSTENQVEEVETNPKVHLNLSSFTEKQEETPEVKEEVEVKGEEVPSIEATKQIESTQVAVEKEEEITSKVNIDDVIDETTPKDDGSEVFENYKSVFDEDGKKMIKNKNLGTEVKEVPSLQANPPKEETKVVAPKKKNSLWVILVVVVILAILWAMFVFKDQILELFDKDTTPVEGVIPPLDEQEDNPPVEQQPTENETNNGTGNLSPTEQEDLNNYIEEVTGNNPELTPQEINTLIRKKIIEIYLKRNIR